MTRVFDRDSEDYKAIAVLLTREEQDLLDAVLTTEEGLPGPPIRVEEWAKAIDAYAAKHSLASSTRAKLRIACWFWNGTPRLKGSALDLEWADPRYFDGFNRRRFLRAMAVHLDLPEEAVL